MKGVNYLTNSKGEKTAIVFDLKEYKEELIDFMEGLTAASRVNEPAVEFETAVKKIIRKKTKRVSRTHKKIS
jgi:hypothetical protein